MTDHVDDNETQDSPAATDTVPADESPVDALRREKDALQDRLLRLAAGRTAPPLVKLSGCYKLLTEFERRFPAGAPSLVDCESLVIDADVTFGAGVVVRGSVHLTEDQHVPDRTILQSS